VTNLADAIDALRSAVCSPDSGESEAVHAAVDPSVFADADVVSVPDEETLAHVSVTLREPATIEELEATLGPARRLPRSPSGGARTVLFDDTLPAEGESGATVLAEVDDDDRVSRLIIRADSF
jgi:hypothetical protein